jgi:hypothetical protein
MGKTIQFRAAQSENIAPDSTLTTNSHRFRPTRVSRLAPFRPQSSCAAGYDIVIRPHPAPDHVSFRHEQSLLPLDVVS